MRIKRELRLPFYEARKDKYFKEHIRNIRWQHHH